jgi:hypothetical protein
MTDSESIRELAPRPAGTTEGADRDSSIGSQAPEVVGICTTFTRRPPPSLAPSLCHLTISYAIKIGVAFSLNHYKFCTRPLELVAGPRMITHHDRDAGTGDWCSAWLVARAGSKKHTWQPWPHTTIPTIVELAADASRRSAAMDTVTVEEASILLRTEATLPTYPNQDRGCASGTAKHEESAHPCCGYATSS